ncbi:MAG: Eco57I restriction-modification methylase domain-containing protein [Candidatus Helarchaeota archaeon]
MRETDINFLTRLNDWRLILAQNIYERNKNQEFQLQNTIFKLTFSSDNTIRRSLSIVKESIQRLLERLLIIRFAEDNAILDLPTLKTLINKGNASKRMVPKMRLLRELFQEWYDFSMNPIFAPNHICDQVHIDDEVLNILLKELNSWQFQEFSPQLLGYLYETYLEYELILQNGKVNFKRNFKDRKGGGIYYTPPYIVDFIVKKTLQPFLEKIDFDIHNAHQNEKDEVLSRIISELRKIKVLDPACGSGIFLIYAYKLINSFFKELTGAHIPDLPELILKHNLFGVDLDPHAAEIASISLFLQALQTGGRGHRQLQPIIKVGNALIAGDKHSLEPIYGAEWEKIDPFSWENEFPDVFNSEKFTIIIGNPPYIAWNRIPFRRMFETGKYLDLIYECRPNHGDAQPNIYLFFLVRAINLIKHGKIGFILPQEWRFENYARKFRNYFLKKSTKIEIVRFNPRFKVFKNRRSGVGKKIGTNSLLLFLEIGESQVPEQKLIEYYIDEVEEEKVIRYLENPTVLETKSTIIVKNFDELVDQPWVFAQPQEEALKKKIESLPNLIYLTNTSYFLVKGGFQPPINEISKFQITFEVAQTLFPQEQQYIYPAILDASNIQRYYLNRQDHYWIILNDFTSEKDLRHLCPNLYELLKKRMDSTHPSFWTFPNIRNFELIKKYPVKLLCPRTASRPSFCLDECKTVFKGTNTMVISLKLHPYYVLGILNSTLANFWYMKFGCEYHGEKTKKFEPQKVREYSLPIVHPPNREIAQQLVTLVRKYLSLKRKEMDEHQNVKSELRTLDDQIDELVFTLYNLTSEEIQLMKMNNLKN